MARIRSRDTGPERIVRGLLRSMGIAHRMHRADLPGRPDFAVASRRTCVFVHGCFWHGHICRNGRLPRTRRAWWKAKIETNRRRDRRAARALRRMGWSVVTVWECSTKDKDRLGRRLRRVLA